MTAIPWLYGTRIEDSVLRIENLFGLYELGSRMNELYAKASTSNELRDIAQTCQLALFGINYVRASNIVPLEAIKGPAEELFSAIEALTAAQYLKHNWDKNLNALTCTTLRQRITQFQYALSEELRQLPVYFVEPKGLLSIKILVGGASSAYRPLTRQHLDAQICTEIDEAGKCLAYSRTTACGFHILRSVEIAIKGYLHASTGALPPLRRRNWGEYITQLTAAGAGADLIDLLRILQKMRNPLMHPQDTLDVNDAINVFNISQSVTDALVDDVIAKSLETKLAASLAALPTI
jgi:hypothetical protein